MVKKMIAKKPPSLRQVDDDFKKRKSRSASRCPVGEIWVENSELKGGGYCRKAPKGSGISPVTAGKMIGMGGLGIGGVVGGVGTAVGVGGLLTGAIMAATANKQVEETQQDLSVLRQRHEQVRREKQQAESDLDTVTGELDNAYQRIKVSDKQIQDLSIRQQEIEQERERIQGERDRILQVAEGLEKGLSRKKEQVQKLRSQQKATASDLESTQNELNRTRTNLQDLSEEYDRNTARLLAERGQLADRVQTQSGSDKKKIDLEVFEGETSTTLGIPEKRQKLPQTVVPPPSDPDRYKETEQFNANEDLNERLENFEKDLAVIDKNLPLHEQNIAEFKSFEKHFPEEAQLFKFYEVSRAVTQPINAQKGRNLTPFESIEDFINNKASGKYQGNFSYTDYMTIGEPTNPVKSVGEYRQFLEKTDKATKQPIADIYERVQKHYINHYRQQGYSSNEARQMGIQVSTAIYGDSKQYVEDLKKSVQERIKAIDDGKIVLGEDGNFYEKKN